MPELPEVETIRRDLAPRVAGRTITSLTVMPGAKRMLVGVPTRRVRARLVDRRIEGIERRGKYLLFQLDSGSVWVMHLRMTGTLRHRSTGGEPDPFQRIVVTLDDGSELRFTDIRKFGTFEVLESAEEVTCKLGIEPLTQAFTEEALWSALHGRKAPLKSTLLDQRRIAGLGNIYVDEALFLARLHPAVPAGSLRPAERRALHAAIEEVIREGIAHRGASFRDYTDAEGKDGRQQFFVRVFRRTDEPCDVCGTPIRRTVIGGRASHWCPRCQPARQTSRRVPRKRARRSASIDGTDGVDCRHKERRR